MSRRSSFASTSLRGTPRVCHEGATSLVAPSSSRLKELGTHLIGTRTYPVDRLRHTSIVRNQKYRYGQDCNTLATPVGRLGARSDRYEIGDWTNRASPLVRPFERLQGDLVTSEPARDHQHPHNRMSRRFASGTNPPGLQTCTPRGCPCWILVDLRASSFFAEGKLASNVGFLLDFSPR
jgi:hypothetical protein